MFKCLFGWNGGLDRRFVAALLGVFIPLLIPDWCIGGADSAMFRGMVAAPLLVRSPFPCCSMVCGGVGGAGNSWNSPACQAWLYKNGGECQKSTR